VGEGSNSSGLDVLTFTRAALSTDGRGKSKFLSVQFSSISDDLVAKGEASGLQR